MFARFDSDNFAFIVKLVFLWFDFSLFVLPVAEERSELLNKILEVSIPRLSEHEPLLAQRQRLWEFFAVEHHAPVIAVLG